MHSSAQRFGTVIEGTWTISVLEYGTSIIEQTLALQRHQRQSMKASDLTSAAAARTRGDP